MDMDYYWWYIFSAIVVAISIIGVIFCIVRGKGISHKILIFFTALLCAVAMFCFGGNAILSMFGMGWRCEPFNTMLHLCFVLIIPILLCGVKGLISLKDTNPAFIGCGVTSMFLAIFITLLLSSFYFTSFSWSDGLTAYDDQTIVYKTNGHGSFGSWHYYTHINGLVHGIEITQDGWHGVPPRSFS